MEKTKSNPFNPSPIYYSEEEKVIKEDNKISELFEAQLLEQTYSIAAPLQKIEEKGVPTGRFFCTHTFTKRNLAQPTLTLDSHKFIEAKLNTAIDEQVQRKLGKNYLKQCIALEESTSATIDEGLQQAFKSTLNNAECKQSRQAFKENQKEIDTLKKEILTYKAKRNKVRPSYIEIYEKCKSLENSEAAREGLNNLITKYQNLKKRIDLLQTYSIENNIQSEKLGEEAQKILNEIKSIFNPEITKLKQLCLPLNKTIFFKELQFLSTIANNFNILDGILHGLRPENTGWRESAQKKLNGSSENVFQALSSFQKVLNQIVEYKNTLEDEKKIATPDYIQTRSSLANLSNNKKEREESRAKFVKEIVAVIKRSSQDDAYSIKEHKEALTTLKEEISSTFEKIKKSITQIDIDASKGNESEKMGNTLALEELKDEVMFFNALANLGSQIFDPLIAPDLLKQLSDKTKREIRNEINDFTKNAQLYDIFAKRNMPINSIFERRNRAISHKITFLDKELSVIKLSDIEKCLEEKQNQLFKAQKARTEIIHKFLKQIKLSQNENAILNTSLQDATSSAQKLIQELLIEYQIHSQNRFNKLFTAHRHFVIRLNYLLSKMNPEVAAEVKCELNLFLKEHATAASKANKTKQLLLYRQMQGKHTDDLQLQKCREIQAIVAKQFSLIFGKKIAAKEFHSDDIEMQAAHVMPFSGLFSWQSDFLISQLFKSTMQIESSKDQIISDIEAFVPSIQKDDGIDFTQVQAELDSRSQNLKLKESSKLQEFTSEHQKFIVDALLFLSRISSLEMSETQHFPNWFNQKMDAVSEVQITKTHGTEYKILLGQSLIELIEMQEIAEDTPLVSTDSQILYLGHTIAIVQKRLETLVGEQGERKELTVFELLECHALISIFSGIQQLNIKALQEKERPVESLLNRLKLKTDD